MVGPPIVGMIIDRTGTYRIAIAAAFAVAMCAVALLIPLTRYESMEAPARAGSQPSG